MKLSFKTILPIVLIFTLLILLAGCFITPLEEQPGYTPGTITGIIAAPCWSTSAGPVTEPNCVYPEYWCCYCGDTWSLQDGVEVILTYGVDKVATTTTNEDGEYTFTNVPPGKNYVITAYCPDFDDNRPLVKDVALEVVEGKTYDAKITDCVSTALGLVVDYLVENTTVLGPEDIVLDGVIAGIPNFYGFPEFKKLVERICEISPGRVNLFDDEKVPDYLCRGAQEIGRKVIPDLDLGCTPGYTPGPPPTPGACAGNLVPIIDSVKMNGELIAINDTVNVILGESYDIVVIAHDQDTKLGILTYYATVNGVESAATTTGQITVTPTVPGTFEVYAFVHDGCAETPWGPVTVVVECCPFAEPGVTIDISEQKTRSKDKGTILSLCLDKCATINSVTIHYSGPDPLPDDLVITPSYSGKGLSWVVDSGISFDPTTGAVCLIGGAETGIPGTYTITVTYTDPCGKTANGSVDIEFKDCDPCAGNTAPYFTSTPVITAVGGASYYYNADATDPDLGDTLTYAKGIINWPTWLSLDIITGEISGTAPCCTKSRCEPPTPPTCNFDVDVEVSDGCTTVTQSFTITVTEINEHSPEVDSVTLTIAEGVGTWTYSGQVNAHDDDAYGFITKYELTGSSNPLGLEINATTGVLSGSTNSNPWGGSPKHVHVKVKVTDNGCTPKTDEESFTIYKPS